LDFDRRRTGRFGRRDWGAPATLELGWGGEKGEEIKGNMWRCSPAAERPWVGRNPAGGELGRLGFQAAAPALRRRWCVARQRGAARTRGSPYIGARGTGRRQARTPRGGGAVAPPASGRWATRGPGS
jgi:hypothetical protein